MADNANVPSTTNNKIIPRNLTARASHSLAGNPPTSRPESVVANCFPGLEVDNRNLEQRFISGFTFEYQRSDGAIVSSIEANTFSRLGLSSTDFSPTAPLFLWSLYGRFAPSDKLPVVVGFLGISGLDAWRRVHDLMPGRVVLIVGPGPAGPESIDSSTASTEFNSIFKDSDELDHWVVRRTADDELSYIVFSAMRTPYLDSGGLIEVPTYGPGDLSKSLCAPWIYDFRDCYCFFWAASKPDIVASADGTQGFANYLRKDRHTTPTPPDVTVYDGRSDNELTYIDLAAGMWEQLPIVVNDRELPGSAPSQLPHGGELLSRSEAIAELRYLATVELALATQYLYAHYSVALPRMNQAESLSSESLAIHRCASQLMAIAIDEMRHFRWVNEILSLMGETPSTSRAEILGQAPTGGDGRKIVLHKAYLNRRFTLEALTADRLQWFIDVEAPSRVFGEKLDGMYCQLLVSVDSQSSAFPDQGSIVPLLKLLIDEGQGHYEHLVAIQESLRAVAPDKYLRSFRNAETGREKIFVDLADCYYNLIRSSLGLAFCGPVGISSTLIHASTRMMRNLGELAELLASSDIAVTYKISEGVQFRMPDQRQALVQQIGREISQIQLLLERLGALRSSEADSSLLSRHAADCSILASHLARL